MQIQIDFTKTVPMHGSTFTEKFDGERLRGQLFEIWKFMKDGSWRTLKEIEIATGAPQSSASAQLRNLRKVNITVEKRPRGDRLHGLWEYRVIAT